MIDWRYSLLLLPLSALLLPAARAQADVAQYEAIDDLGYSTDQAAQSAESLKRMLSSEDAQIRWRSARALGNLGDAAKSASPALVKLLADSDPVVQMHASIALARIGDKSDPVLQAIVAKVTSKDERVARTAIQTLRQLEAPPEMLAGALEKVLESDSAAVMSHAIHAIVQRGETATPFLVAALGKEKTAYWAAIAIADIGPAAAGTVPALIELLGESKDSDTLQLALVALAKIGPPAAEAASAVQSLAEQTTDDAQRIAACYAMGAIGDLSSAPLLGKLTSSGGPFQEMVCAWSLAMLHPNDPEATNKAVKSLVAGLKSDRERMRNAAAAGLLELKLPPGVVGPVLIEELKNANDQQRATIAHALASLGPEIVDRAVAALKDEGLRGVAIEVLGRLGPEAAAGVQGLTECLAVDSPETVARAQYALASIGAASSPATARLAANLSSNSEEVRHSALFAIRQIGPGAQAAAEPLHELLGSASSDFDRYAAAWTLAKLKLNPQQLEGVTKALTEALASDDQRIRLETLTAIADLVPAKAAFLEKLKQLAEEDPSAEVRAAAAGLISGNG